MIEIGLPWFQVNGLGETLYRLLVVALTVQTDSLIVEGKCILWVYLDCLAVIHNGSFEIAQLIIGETTVEEGFEMVG